MSSNQKNENDALMELELFLIEDETMHLQCEDEKLNDLYIKSNDINIYLDTIEDNLIIKIIKDLQTYYIEINNYIKNIIDDFDNDKLTLNTNLGKMVLEYV